MNECDLEMMNKKLVFPVYVLAFFLFTILGTYMIVVSSAVEPTNEPVYFGISKYYDNRKAVVTVTADDWIDYTWIDQSNLKT